MARLLTQIEYECPEDDSPYPMTTTVEVAPEDVRYILREYPDYRERTIVHVEHCPRCGQSHDFTV